MSSVMPTVSSWEHVALHDPGRVMIDASAGTGKTYTIAMLYIRLLLQDESRLPRHILVSTFTVAAADELRSRIAVRMAAAMRHTLGARNPDHDPLLEWLDQRWLDDPTVEATDRRHLRRCWAEMDAAPISTLHSLCTRILADHAVLTGQGFVESKLVDPEELLELAVNDIWRQEQSTPEGAARLEQLKLDQRSKLLNRVKPFLKPSLRPLIASDFLEPGDLISDRELAALALEMADLIETTDTVSFLKPAKSLPTELRQAVENLQSKGTWLLPSDKIFASLTNEQDLRISLLFKKNHELGELPERLNWQNLSLLGRVSVANREADSGELVKRIKASIAQYKEHLRLTTFDDLVSQVRAALTPEANGGDAGSNASKLAKALYDKWPVALIDEFQDTDNAQFRILDRIYRKNNGELRGRLLMIGDPKQAIYSFRGGDIHVFTSAAAACTDPSLTLNSNYRASAEVIAGLNEFHDRYGKEFKVTSDDIQFKFTDITDPKADRRVIGSHPGLVLWHYDPPLGKNDKKRPVGLLRYDAAQGVASHMVQLLNGTLSVDGNPVEPGKIAVLTYTNEQAAAIQRALTKKGIPCVLSKNGTVFDSPWTLELQLLLASALHPSDLHRARAVLLSRLFGKDLLQVRSMTPEQEQGLLDQVGEWRAALDQGGVLGMVDSFLRSNYERLSGRNDYERLYTDMRHLAELMQTELAAGMPATELAHWMARQQSEPNDPNGSDRSRRMEAEGGKVQVMTVWASKGLEFDVVYVPFAWNRNAKKLKPNELATVRVPGSEMRRPERSAEEKQQYHNESLEEDLRLLYVAMTRAKRQTHLFAVSTEMDESRSALAVRLQHHGEFDPSIATSSSFQIRDTWPQVVSDRYEQRATKPHSEHIDVKRKPDAASSTQWMHSYSRLADRHESQLSAVTIDQPAQDEMQADAPELEAPTRRTDGLWSVAGSVFGDVLHKAMQLALPQPKNERLLETVRRAREIYGFQVPTRHGVAPMTTDQFDHHLRDLLIRNLDVPLLLDDPTLTLRSLSGAAIRREMDFHFRVIAGSKAQEQFNRQVEDVVANESRPQRIADWKRAQSFLGDFRFNGYLKGSMDLVFEHAGRFFVLDYKSNVLTGHPSSFTPESIDALAMRDGPKYILQVLVYSVALHRYLKSRVAGYDPSQHLGGALYVFARGVDEPEAGPRGGIWYEPSDVELILAVDALLSTVIAEEAA